jgi:hypothetical protein
MRLDLASLLPAVAPVLMGFTIGFLVGVSALWRWFAQTTVAGGRDLVAGLKRTGLQYLAGGVLLTLAAAHLLSGHLHQSDAFETAKLALWGLPVGLFFGVRWVYRRGAR